MMRVKNQATSLTVGLEQLIADPIHFSPPLGVEPSEPRLSQNFWDRGLARACRGTSPSDPRHFPPLGMTCDPKPPANMQRDNTVSKLTMFYFE